MIKLVGAAIESGICNERLLERLNDIASIEMGGVSRDNLLHIYRRRLKRTPPGSQLQTETVSLISFLEQYQRDDLVMVSISLGMGGGDLFLMDSNGDRILHWMSMFSR